MANKKVQAGFLKVFDFNRDNRPDAREEDTTPGIKRYFKMLGRRIWKLISLNLMMLPMILPLLLIGYFYIGMDKTPTQTATIFPQIFGANLIESTPTTTYLLDLFGAQLEVPIFMDVSAYVMIAISAIFPLVTFGWQSVGSAYILRSMVRGEPVFLFTDYFYAVRRNLKQGFLMGVVDLLAMLLLVFDFIFFSTLPSSFWIDIGFFVVGALVIIYFFMRFYIYLMLVTFELSIRKLLKNAFIFVMLGIKRNLMGVLGILLIAAVNVGLFLIFRLTPLGIAIPLIVFILHFVAVASFTSAYAAYPVIDRYMIAPYREADEDDADTEDAPADAE